MNDRSIPEKKAGIILYDGYCHLCTRLVRFTKKRDRKGSFEFVAQQSDKGKKIMERINTDEDSIVLLEGKNPYFKSAAALRVFRELGGFYTFIYHIFKHLPVKLNNAVYDFIARNRYRWFGKRTECACNE